ncbi:hypothetical protein CPB85DRAFT_1496367 [Mucidula mucida]|nr:hypothetical protein CPB85DRAFT_1496367 [Mucidula mucida]
MGMRMDAVVQTVDAPKAGWRDFWGHFSAWENFKVLFGAAYSWFALDIAFYGLGLSSSIVLQAIGFGNAITAGSQGVYDNLHKIWELDSGRGRAVPGILGCVLVHRFLGTYPADGFHSFNDILCYHGLWIREDERDQARTEGVRLPVLPRQLLPELWTEYDYVHHPWGSLSHPIPLYDPYYMRCKCHHFSGRICAYARYWWHRQLRKAYSRNLCLVHADGHLLDAACARLLRKPGDTSVCVMPSLTRALAYRTT